MISDSEPLLNYPFKLLHTFVYMDFQDFALPRHLTPLTRFTPVLGVDALSLPLTRRAHGLDLLHHAGPKLTYVDLHTCPPTCVAFLHCPLLTSPSCE